MGRRTRSRDDIGRRTALKVLAGSAAAAGLPRAAAQDEGTETETETGTETGTETEGDGGGGGEINYDGWFDDVGNFDSTQDATGQSEVNVTVGAEGNGGAFAFEPAAIRIDPGTTVVWEWTGGGGVHNVVDDDGAYGSELVDEEGVTFEQTFDSPALSKYYCDPHRSLGMKGAVVVGEPETGGGGGGGSTGPFGVGPGMYAPLAVGVAFVMALLSPLLFVFVLLRNRDHL